MSKKWTKEQRKNYKNTIIARRLEKQGKSSLKPSGKARKTPSRESTASLADGEVEARADLHRELQRASSVEARLNKVINTLVDLQLEVVVLRDVLFIQEK